jgi:glycerophosphoryl diester phosphodiesterase
VATTRDGVLVLMHDDTLDRTTTGSEQVTEKNWPEIQTLKIKRPDGVILDERVPRFADGSHFVGSTATMPRTARLLREDVGLAEDEVRRLVSANPRRLLA